MWKHQYFSIRETSACQPIIVFGLLGIVRNYQSCYNFAFFFATKKERPLSTPPPPTPRWKLRQAAVRAQTKSVFRVTGQNGIHM